MIFVIAINCPIGLGWFRHMAEKQNAFHIPPKAKKNNFSLPRHQTDDGASACRMLIGKGF